MLARFLLALLLTTTCFAQDRVQTLAKAIAKAEGCYVKGTIPNRYHNCGDLKAVRGYRFPGQVGVGKGGHVRFKNDAAGWAALTHQIDKIIAGDSRYTVNMNLKEISKKYAGNWRVWSKNVAHSLGVTPSTDLWEILDVPPILEAR
jgi:hypothetical protein